MTTPNPEKTLRERAREKAVEVWRAFPGNSGFAPEGYTQEIDAIESAILDGMEAALALADGWQMATFHSIYDGENELTKRLHIAMRQDLAALKKQLREPK